MKFALKSLVIASAFVMAGAAQAESVKGTLTTTDSITALGWEVSALNGSGALTFSKSLLTALNAGGIEVTGIAPADLQTTKSGSKYTSISANAPVTTLTGTFDGTALAVNAVTTQGGASLLAIADDLTNSGGSLSITNLAVDLDKKIVYADVNGGNGVGFKSRLAMWNYSTITGATNFTAVEGPITSNNTISGLTITTAAFDTFVASLGLLDSGVSAMKRITDYGTVVSTIGATAHQIPEPSTYALMALGLVGVVAAKRARRA